MFEPFLDLESLKKTGLYPEDFDERLAPERYFLYKKKLLTRPPKFDVFVAYGMRRMGKTYALIKLGEIAQKQGFEFLYYEASKLDANFLDRRNAGRIANSIKRSIVEESKRFFIVLDEAFNVPIHSIRSFLGPFSKLKEGFIIALSGSYTYDLISLKAEIGRIFPNLARRRKFNATLPRISLSTSPSVFEVFNTLLYVAVKNNEGFLNLNPVNFNTLISSGLIDGITGEVSKSVLKTFEEYKTHGGAPPVIKGSSSLEDLVEVFVDTLLESFTADIEYFKQKISWSIEGDRPTGEDLVEKLKSRMRASTRGVEIKLGSLMDVVPLSTCLILPRRRLQLPLTMPPHIEIIHRGFDMILKADLRASLRGHPIPSSYFSYLVLKRIGAKMYSGIVYESIVAHALLSHYLFHRNTDVFPWNIPIFSSKAVDFIAIAGTKPPHKVIAIEVKSSLSDLHSIIASALEASKIGLWVLVLVPSAELNYTVPNLQIGIKKGITPSSSLIMKLKDAYMDEEGNLIVEIYLTDTDVLKIVYGRLPEEFLEGLLGAYEEGILLLPPIVFPLELFVAVAAGQEKITKNSYERSSKHEHRAFRVDFGGSIRSRLHRRLQEVPRP